MRAALHVFGIIAMATRVACGAAAPAGGDADRIAELNRGFLKHLDALPGAERLKVETIRSGYRDAYEKTAPESFIPDALALLYADVRTALEAFDADRSAEAARQFEPLATSADPYLAASARYYLARALIDRGLLEEAERVLTPPGDRSAGAQPLTPYAPHLLFMLAYTQSANLRHEQAQQTLRQLATLYGDAPEAVRIGGRQLMLELERRERGTLGEAAEIMDYSAQRLSAADAGDQTRQRQEQVIALLDKLIKERQEQEQQSRSSGGVPRRGHAGGKGAQPGAPSGPRPESQVEPGVGKVGELHGAPKPDAVETWGKLPPAERERILQSLRDRFPSRYRQLVEQYYRSLAESK